MTDTHATLAPLDGTTPRDTDTTGARHDVRDETELTVAKGSTADDKSADEIKAGIEATQQHLAATVDELADRVSPKNVAARAQSSLKAQVVDPRDGALRVKRVAIAAGGAVVLVALKVWRAKR